MCRAWSSLLTSWGRHERGKADGELREARFPGWEPGRGSCSSLGSLGHPCSSVTPWEGQEIKRGREMDVPKAELADRAVARVMQPGQLSCCHTASQGTLSANFLHC